MLTTLNQTEIDTMIDAIHGNVRRDGPYRAELVPGCEPVWHVVLTGPRAENLAAAHLVARGFGCYVPTFERARLVRRQLRSERRPLFPGHIFLFVWDVRTHWRRIHACPGVRHVLTVDEQPVVVEDEAIDRMQAIEFSGLTLPDGRRKRKRRRWRRTPQPSGHDADDAQIVAISTKSYWGEGLTALDDKARIRILYHDLCR